MTTGALLGGALAFSATAFLLFVISTAIVLLFGHSLGSHRKLVHDSFQCPKWLEYALMYLGASKSDWLGRSACFTSMSFATLRNAYLSVTTTCATGVRPGVMLGGN